MSILDGCQAEWYPPVLNFRPVAIAGQPDGVTGERAGCHEVSGIRDFCQNNVDFYAGIGKAGAD